MGLETAYMERNYIVEAIAQTRPRASWNDRLVHWEKPASDSEEAIIQRAAGQVRVAISKNNWLRAEGVRIEPQGSYHNNTNVRQESDIDLRAVHPMLRVVYAESVVQSSADQALGYSYIGRFFPEVLADMRREMWAMLASEFGDRNVEDGGKAFRVKSVPGSRAPVDVVPCFKLHYVRWNMISVSYDVAEGIVILPRAGAPIFNFPEQHYQNGIAKRALTQHRFKKNVRMLKRLRDELVDLGKIQKGQVPSFLIECLVYEVEDYHFFFEADDRYDRLLRIVRRIGERSYDPNWINSATEINGVKLLFGSHQPWTANAVSIFAEAAYARLTA